MVSAAAKMDDNHANSGADMELQSKETRNLLDVVDKLRSHGISRYIDLPQIIVCGEQSSGKSSILEAVSNVKFPSKDNLCTRFATELILRRGPELPMKASIVPGGQVQRSEIELAKLKNFHMSLTGKVEFGDIIESAKAAMGIDDKIKVFSSDILRLELSGPHQPHLTIVDLPGLFFAGSRAQSEADSATVKELVLSYMKNPRSIILAVVSAKNDFANQVITKYSGVIDPKGTRTLGLITKPDTLHEGSDSERFYIELARNQDVALELGWHVLRNRDYTTRDSSSEDRDKIEAQFFASGVWRSLPPSQVGAQSLKVRLSKILKDHILAQLPEVLSQIRQGILDCTRRLTALGGPRSTAPEMRRFLLQTSQAFSSLVSAAVEGHYTDPFFGDVSSADGYKKRLRAVLQNTLTDFAEAMRKNGHALTIVEGKAQHPTQISRSDYIVKVKKLFSLSRGKELPGTFDPLVVGHLFRAQREPWDGLIEFYLQSILGAVSFLAHEVLAHICDHATLVKLSKHFIGPRLDSLTADLRDKVQELLKPHNGHPVTYNHYLTENVQKAQAERRATELKKSLEKYFGGDFSKMGTVSLPVNVNALLNTLVEKTEADMDNYAMSSATDFMEAYYKVALKKIVDDFSVLAVEARLIQELPNLFCPSDVIDIDEETMRVLAAEDEDSLAQRSLYNEKLETLRHGLKELRGFEDPSLKLREGGAPKRPFPESSDLGGGPLNNGNGVNAKKLKAMPGNPKPQVKVPASPAQPQSKSQMFATPSPSPVQLPPRSNMQFGAPSTQLPSGTFTFDVTKPFGTK